MIKIAISFFILALVTFVFGAYGIAGLSMEIGRILVAAFVIISVVSLITGIVNNRKIKSV